MGDSNLIASNIKSGVNIFGVTGTLTEGLKEEKTTLSWSSSQESSLSVNIGGYGQAYQFEKLITTPYTFTTSYYPKYIGITVHLTNLTNYNNLTIAGAIYNTIFNNSGTVIAQDACGQIQRYGNSTMYYGLNVALGIAELPTNIIGINWTIPTSMYSYFNSFSSTTRDADLFFIFN